MSVLSFLVVLSLLLAGFGLLKADYKVLGGTFSGLAVAAFLILMPLPAVLRLARSNRDFAAWFFPRRERVILAWSAASVLFGAAAGLGAARFRHSLVGDAGGRAGSGQGTGHATSGSEREHHHRGRNGPTRLHSPAAGILRRPLSKEKQKIKVNATFVQMSHGRQEQAIKILAEMILVATTQGGSGEKTEGAKHALTSVATGYILRRSRGENP